MLERLDADIKSALLSGDKARARALQFVKNSLQVVAKDSGAALSEEQAITVLRKEVKKRIEAAEFFRKGGNDESAEKELYEVDLIKNYLPPEVDEAELVTIINKIITDNNLPLEVSSMGRVMGLAKQALGDKADPTKIAKVAQDLLKTK